VRQTLDYVDKDNKPRLTSERNNHCNNNTHNLTKTTYLWPYGFHDNLYEIVIKQRVINERKSKWKFVYFMLEIGLLETAYNGAVTLIRELIRYYNNLYV